MFTFGIHFQQGVNYWANVHKLLLRQQTCAKQILFKYKATMYYFKSPYRQVSLLDSHHRIKHQCDYMNLKSCLFQCAELKSVNAEGIYIRTSAGDM